MNDDDDKPYLDPDGNPYKYADGSTVMHSHFENDSSLEAQARVAAIPMEDILADLLANGTIDRDRYIELRKRNGLIGNSADDLAAKLSGKGDCLQ